MKRKGPLLEALAQGVHICDKCLAERLELGRPQAVNGPGNKLVEQGHAVRVEANCATCGGWRSILVFATDRSLPQPTLPTRVRRQHQASKALVMDGHAALQDLVQRAGYGTLEAAIAAHTLFLHPSTVAQTHGRAVFPIVRGNARKGIHKFEVLPDGRKVWIDNNIPVKQLPEVW